MLRITLLLLIALTNAFATGTPNVGIFTITSFLNSGSPHSISARLSFTLSSTCSTAPLTNITCSYSQSVQPTVATTIGPVACNDTSILFTFEYNFPGNGYYLSITHLSNGKKTVDTGLLYMGNHVETVEDQLNPNGDFQKLVHDSDFEMGFNRVADCC